jgi:hypothetical protein
MASSPSDDRDADDTVSSDADVTSATGRRDVVVPMRVYKTVTVFSTLLAVLGVVVGFVLLDAATIRLSLLRRLVAGALLAVGVTPPETVLSAVLAVLGVAAIAFGAGVYVLGTRFRARGMGNAQEAAAESSDDG